MWLIQGFDLGFTICAAEGRTFTEANPLGAWALQHGPRGAILFKASLLTFSTAVLWRFRSRLISECLLWIVMAACVGLSLRWHDYYRLAADSAEDVVRVNTEILFPSPPWAHRIVSAAQGGRLANSLLQPQGPEVPNRPANRDAPSSPATGLLWGVTAGSWPGETPR